MTATRRLFRPAFASLAACALLFAFVLPARAGTPPDDPTRATRAIEVLRDVQDIPESAIPDKLLDEARGIVIVPDTLKVGFIFGGRRGYGLMALRREDGTWSPPVYVRLTGASVGLQAGVQSADLVLVFRSRRGLDSIVAGKFTLGADAGVAAGPVGRTAATATDGQLQAEIWSWSRARGLFAGVSLDGAVLAIDDDANQRMYGAGSTPRMIFEQRTPRRAPDVLVSFQDALEEASASAHNRRADVPAPPAATAAATPAPAPVPAPEATDATPAPAAAPAAAVTTEALPEPAGRKP